MQNIANWINSKILQSGRLEIKDKQYILDEIKKISVEDIEIILKNTMISINQPESTQLYLDLFDIRMKTKDKKSNIKKYISNIRRMPPTIDNYWCIQWLEAMLAVVNIKSGDKIVRSLWKIKLYERVRECIVVSAYKKNDLDIEFSESTGCKVEVDCFGQFDIIRAPGNEYLDENPQDIIDETLELIKKEEKIANMEYD